MKKNLLTILAMLALMAGGTSIMAQWAQYNADALPEDDATVNISAGASLLGGTSVIIVDPDDATNHLWSYNVNLDAADELKYSWYPSYWDQNSTENTYVPAPSTIACKFKWADTTSAFGPRLELREVYKVNATPVKKAGKFLIEINDWGLDSLYNLPESFDLTEWHVIRLTLDNGAWNLYIDENATPFGSGTAGKQVDKHLALFSAYGSSGKSEIMIDWMGYIEDAASSPTDMPLPAGIFEPSSGTSVNSLNASEMLSLYPNPVSDMLSVSVGNDMINSRYELVNITGKVIQRGLLKSRVNRVDVSGFNAGLYFVRVVSGDKVISDSFIVK